MSNEPRTMNPPEYHYCTIRHQLNVKEQGTQLAVWANSMNRAVASLNGVTRMLYDVVPKDYALVRAQDTLFLDIRGAFERFFANLDSLKKKEPKQ